MFQLSIFVNNCEKFHVKYLTFLIVVQLFKERFIILLLLYSLIYIQNVGMLRIKSIKSRRTVVHVFCYIVCGYLQNCFYMFLFSTEFMLRQSDNLYRTMSDDGKVQIMIKRGDTDTSTPLPKLEKVSPLFLFVLSVVLAKLVYKS